MHVMRSGPPSIHHHLKSISPCIVCPKLFTGHHYSYSVVLLVLGNVVAQYVHIVHQVLQRHQYMNLISRGADYVQPI